MTQLPLTSGVGNYTIRIDFTNGTHAQIENVLEFVGGHKFLFVRTSSSTLSFERALIKEVVRKTNYVDSDWLPVLLKKVKTK